MAHPLLVGLLTLLILLPFLVAYRIGENPSVDKPHILYAMPHSLYSGRARSYLIKNGIPFKERSTGHESFKADVLPKGKLPTIPTLSQQRAK